MSDGQAAPYAINRSAYPSDGAPLDSSAKVSPAVVTILDGDQGIVHLDYQIDPNRTFEMILPSQMDTGTGPTANIRDRSHTIAFNAVIEGSQPPKLSSAFKLAILLTVTPASPNTENQLHKIIVKPSDVKSMMPNPTAAALEDCNGPIQEIRIGASMEVARVQWLDGRRNDIEKAIGIQEGEPDLTGLVINEGKSSPQGGASLNNIALAQAASIYASLVDRYQGSMAGYMNAGIEPSGYIATVEHSLDSDGVATTKATFPDDVPQINLFSWLGMSDRKAILHLVRE